jgi:micrococcal nuclease
MKVKQIDKLILLFLILALVALNYSTMDSFIEKTFSTKEEVFVERIIDGDTIESNTGNIRLLGINTPERGEIYYEEAKNFLESEIFNKTVMLEFTREKKDKYNRTLAYIFLDNRNINIEIVKNGFANYYFYDGRDRHSDELEEAWEECLGKKINLCEPSEHSCSSCLDITPINIVNTCAFSCDITNWTVKGEGRDKFVFFNKTIILPDKKAEFELDLTNSGGSLFVRDEKGKLVKYFS